MSENIQARYQKALDYIYSYVNFSMTRQQNLSPENFDLTRMFALMEALENPQDDYPIIHVAGSKGKGSVCAFCESALRDQGYKVGLYTSPHLKDYEERIQISGEPIPRLDLVDLVDEIKPYVAAIPRLTTFEITTALAFLYFARKEVDIAVIEVGLGGRLDATNVLTPIVSVITALYLEHTYVLGDTLPEIAAEKAGIIKPGVPVVLAPQRESTGEVVAEIAARQDSPLTLLGVDYQYKRVEASLDGQIFTIENTGGAQLANQEKLNIHLLGPHQIENAAIAYVALQIARQQGIAIDNKSIRQGFINTKWSARFEVLQREPKPVVIDAAHNPGAAVKLRETLDEYFHDLPIWLVFGVSEDKDIEGMLAELKYRVRKIYCVRAAHPRAMDAEALAEKSRRLGKPVEAIENVGDALEAALKDASEGAVILVTGSIFVAASGRIAWFERSLWSDNAK